MAAPGAGVAWANGKLAFAGLQTVKAPTHPAARMARRIRCFHRMSIVGPLPQIELRIVRLPCRDQISLGRDWTSSLWQQVFDRVSFLLQFRNRLINLAAAEIVHLEAGDNSPVMPITAEWQAGNEP